MSNVDNLLLNINRMTKTVYKQIEDSVEELRTQTRMLTFHDQLISDEMLLNLPPDILRNSLSSDEYKEFLIKYPDYIKTYQPETEETEQEQINETEQIEEIPVTNSSDDQSSSLIHELSDEEILQTLPNEKDEARDQIVTEDIFVTEPTVTDKKESKLKNGLITVGIIGAIVIVLKLLLSF